MRLPQAPGALAGALARLRLQRGRVLLASAGIAAASAMLGSAMTVGFGLGTGFERTAERADLPDVIARFDAEPPGGVERRVRALPNVEAASLRLVVRGVAIASGGRSTDKGVAELTDGGRPGYAIVAGRDLRPSGDEVVIERGLAREWAVGVGDRLRVADLGALSVVGVAVAPDNVAYPLAAGARVYLDRAGTLERYGATGPDGGRPAVNSLLLWVRDPAQLDATLTQARAVSYGVEDLRFVTRSGVQTLIDQAAGIVIALLVAFSLVALLSALLMLGASARADVERRLTTIGVLRAVGFSRSGVTLRHAAEAAVLAASPAALGLAAGALVAATPTADLLGALNQLAPGAALVPLLVACLAAILVLVCAATAWPVWRAAGRPVVETLRGPEVARGDRNRAARRRRRLLAPRGAFGLGARLVAARRVRLAATAGVLALSTGMILLMLALAGLLERLGEDPGTLGKRYELTADPTTATPGEIGAIPGVAAVARRYETEAADSFRLGESMKVIAFPGDHTRFEAPPLAEGRRLRSDAEAEVGVGLAQALGLGVGGTLATQLPNGREARFRVVGIVRALGRDGRIAYTRPEPLLRADPSLTATLAVRLEPGADRAAVEWRFVRRSDAIGGPPPQPTAGPTTGNRGFLSLLADLLRAIAVVNGLVCLYALVQSLSLTALERRGTLATLRAAGAGRSHVTVVLAGAVGLSLLVAVPLGLGLERLVLSPAVAALAADYAELPLRAGKSEVAITLVGVIVIGATATALVARRATREPIVAALREG